MADTLLYRSGETPAVGDVVRGKWPGTLGRTVTDVGARWIWIGNDARDPKNYVLVKRGVDAVRLAESFDAMADEDGRSTQTGADAAYIAAALREKAARG